MRVWTRGMIYALRRLETGVDVLCQSSCLSAKGVGALGEEGGGSRGGRGEGDDGLVGRTMDSGKGEGAGKGSAWTGCGRSTRGTLKSAADDKMAGGMAASWVWLRLGFVAVLWGFRLSLCCIT